jgi:hypoxanthine phosphoribosyltransferase
MTLSNGDRCLYTYDQILDAIHTISRQINLKTQSKEVIFCPVMSGSLVFAGHLLPLLNHQHLSVNYLHYSRYKSDQGLNMGEWKYLPKREELVNRHIILIDDILYDVVLEFKHSISEYKLTDKQVQDKILELVNQTQLI